MRGGCDLRSTTLSIISIEAVFDVSAFAIRQLVCRQHEGASTLITRNHSPKH